MIYFFRCLTNPNGPLFKTDMDFEAEDMRRHPDYEELDADGNVIERTANSGRIPFHPPQPEQKAEPKRKTLGVPKKA
jgi:hypothetical protein